MPKKIPFQVVYATGEDAGYPVSELNTHGPGVRGWRSSPGAPFPQEVVLRLRYPATIVKIQVLAHQFLIPERLELWLHHQQSSEPKTPSSQEYDYLGFVSLADNVSTGFASRELQSVSVACRVGTHLKLRLSKNYANEYNTENQVALIAVNVLGDDSQHMGNGAPGGDVGDGADIEVMSQCDDLAFSMYVEGGVSDVIRDMETRKAQAVKAERFEYARRLKSAMGALRVAGERMGRYELAKRVAVHEEDYQRATLRKEQIEMYRVTVYEALGVRTLLELDGPQLTNDECVDSSRPIVSADLPAPPSLQQVSDRLSGGGATVQPPHSQSSPASGTGVRKVNTNEATGTGPTGRSPNRGSPTNSLGHGGSLRRRNKSAPRSSYEDYEERAVPALRHSQTNEFLRECQSSNAEPPTVETRGRSRLSERERRQAALAILVFGNDLVELFYSKQFSDREDGLTRLRASLRGDSGGNRHCRGASLLLHRAIRDPVFSVYCSAAETVRTLFMEFVPGRVTATEVARAVDRLLPELLSRSGDTSARINTLAQHTVLSVAACPEVRAQHLVAPALSRPVGGGTHPRLALSRLLMLEQVVLSQGIGQDKASGLTCRTLSECGCSGLHHPAEPVRKVAERVLLQVYQVNPRLVRKQLPPDDDITRRNLLYRQLFQEFDKIDIQRKRDIVDRNKMSQHQASVSLSSEFNNLQIEENRTSPIVNTKYSKSVKYSQQTNSYTQDSHKINAGQTRANGTETYDRHNGPENGSNSNSRQQNGSPKHIRQDGAGGKFENIRKSKSGNYLANDVDGAKQNGDLLDTRDSSSKSSNSASPMPDGSIIICSFCGWGGPGITWSQLDRHYWRHCPALTQCCHCQQVVEIATLTQHLLDECDSKRDFKRCARCSEAIPVHVFSRHVEDNICQEPLQDTNRCPLCHSDIRKSNWEEHIRENGCPNNLRRPY